MSTITLTALMLATAAQSPQQAGGGTAQAGRSGETIAIPGATAVDHAGFTVPDLEPAVEFFVDVLGAGVVWRVAPVTGPGRAAMMRDGLNADPRATAAIAMLRLGPSNIVLLHYDIPGATRTMPLNSALNVGHIAFDVTDIDAAGAFLRTKRLRMFAGPRTNANGANVGQKSWFFLSPWGMAIDLVERPERMPYEDETSVRLYRAPRSSAARLLRRLGRCRIYAAGTNGASRGVRARPLPIA